MKACILFSDIAGSTRLYEVHGDTVAQHAVDLAIQEMTKIVTQKSGKVIKTIGDEIMALFPNPSDALWAACEMQKAMRIASGAHPQCPISIRIGIHAGSVIEENGDVFGDTVNTAARVTSLAKPNQILTTAETISLANAGAIPAFRQLASVSVKGKAEPVALREVLWMDMGKGVVDNGDLTMMSGMQYGATLPTGTLDLLVYTHKSSVHVNLSNRSISIGRDPGTQLVVADPKASRTHAIIELRQDKFVLLDQSSNGTFVTPLLESMPGPTVCLRREEYILNGKGIIRLGHNDPDNPWVVNYTVA